MIYQVRHATTLRYATPVALARLNVRLQPADWAGQAVSNFALAVTPLPASREPRDGPFVARCERLRFELPLSELTLESGFTVEVLPAPARGPGPSVAEVRAAALADADLSPRGPASYLYASPLAAAAGEIAGWAGAHFAPERPVSEAAAALMAAIHAEFRYDAGATAADTPPLDAFRARHGVCQDFAHVFIIAARAHGIPAAYVSGYLRTLPPPGQVKLVGADAMHAWAAVWCGPEIGWVGYDPTNDCLAGEDHIFVAMGRDYGDVAPFDGVFHGGGGQLMQYSVDVREVLPPGGGSTIGG